ncbi:hypothetical protein [Aquimarina sp. AU119]|uniref:hypothetical protein n=1 Tax=Aquimarina sp. AU119 TaxID=2108528 RepID=UPI000D686E84|nr:hypothetical protein [Aquimarina sp. AU119]
MNLIVKIIVKILIIILLTVTTQIGGIIYLCTDLLFLRKKNRKKAIIKTITFFSIYTFVTFLILPYVTPLFGRVKIKDSSTIEAHTFLTKFLNRNYVTPQLQNALQQIAHSFEESNPEIKLVYLDANFPFIDNFPLLPHLSHDDGKKIDISFIYKNQEHHIVNKKPSISGYGVFESPTKNEHQQTTICKQKGYWQYDFTQYFTFGTVNKSLKFSKKATKDLLLAIVKQKQVSKVFIEPHLRYRLGIQSPKIRFQGCRAVRHDDHIHLQIR